MYNLQHLALGSKNLHLFSVSCEHDLRTLHLRHDVGDAFFVNPHENVIRVLTFDTHLRISGSQIKNTNQNLLRVHRFCVMSQIPKAKGSRITVQNQGLVIINAESFAKTLACFSV